HPLIIHFPIVAIILLCLFEMGNYFKFLPVSQKVISFTLWLTLISATVSIIAGYLLYASGDYQGASVENHFIWGSLSGAVIFIATGLYYIQLENLKFYWYYFIIVITGTISITITGHLGGLLTHGQGFLTEYLPFIIHSDELKQAKPESEMLVYEDMVAAVLQSKCVSCHNENKKKGGLLMTSYDGLLKGGESGKKTIVPSFPEESDLYNRVILPVNHDDHMPPEGKSPLNDDEKALLAYWISSGASSELKIVEARKDSLFDKIAESLLPDLFAYQQEVILNNIKTEALKKELEVVATQLGVDIYQNPDDKNYFTLAMKFPPAPMTNEQFKILKPYSGLFSKLSLVSSDIDDDGLFYLGQMSSLKELYLQKTGLDGSGLIFLQSLEKLEVLNLSFTGTDDKAVLELLKFPRLKTVYLFGTNTSLEVVEAMRQNRPGLNILLEEGPYF
ncbi:MAG: cytochrome C, partial [Cyclobacteriaceae bacterium]|nr:cytochrome C [Cyclobacteriaceae bacterium]